MSYLNNDFLDDIERNAVTEALSEMLAHRKSISECRQIRDVLPIEKWISSEYYAGPSSRYLYPALKDHLVDIFSDPAKRPNEIIITGSLGGGKSTLATYILQRLHYEDSCFENVTAKYHLMPTTLVAMMYFSISLKLAQLTGYGHFRNTINETQYFQDHFCPNPKVESMTIFPENMVFLAGSDSSHFTGMNLRGSIIDEANFVGVNEAQNVAKDHDFHKVINLYNSIRDRAIGRFMYNGVDHSMSILVSSSTVNTSFTEQRIEKAAGNPKIKVIRIRTYDIKPKGTFSEERFPVFLGSDLLEPFVLETPADVKLVAEVFHHEISDETDKTVKEMIKALPQHIQDLIEWVPMDFKDRFKPESIYMAIQNIIGRAVSPQGKLFSSPDVYKQSIVPDLFHPFTKESFTLATRDTLSVLNYIRKDWQPPYIQHPWHFHIDQSTTTDATGIAAACVLGWKRVDGIDKPVVGMPFQLQIVPPKPPQKISISKTRQIIYTLADIFGVEIGNISYDGFQSTDSMQELQSRGYNAFYRSVDRTDEAYLTYVSMLYEGRIQQYSYEPARKELFGVYHYRDKRRVDHAGPGSSKDVMDAVVGAVMNAIESDECKNHQSSAGETLIEPMDDIDFDEELFTAEDLGLDQSVTILNRDGSFRGFFG